MTAPRRRWFRFAFSLRTLFVVVTIFGCGGGWLIREWRMVQERKAIIAETERNNDPRSREIAHPTLEATELRDNRRHGEFDYLRVSMVRRLLGDESFLWVSISPQSDSEFIDRVEHAFPETELYIGSKYNYSGYRDSLYRPPNERSKNWGTIFKTGLIEK